LIVSGGHTQLVLVHELFQHELLGETRDDAAGEAYDKVAKMLGLGFPGGPMIDKLAATGDPTFIKFPRSYLDENTYDFSFSGIKTSVLYLLRDRKWSFAGQDHPTTTSKTSREVPLTNNRQLISDLCASFQAAVIEVLVEKTLRAAEQLGVREITIAGGVSANSELRKRMKLSTDARNYRLHIPKPAFCTDNGAMVAMLGYLRLMAGMKSDYGMNAAPNLSL
jgi:N6-L-threonylcarbamoyladenine synthase